MIRKPRRTLYVSAAIAMAAVLLSVGSVAPSGAAPQDGQRLQGQVPLKDQLSGRALQGYHQHVQQVGHNNILNRLQNGNLGWVDDCAYVAAYFGNEFEEDPTAGMAVLDVADPRNPELIKIWPGTAGARESQVEGNEDSRMVVAMPFPRASIFGDPAADASLLQIYDVPEGDCTNLDKRGTYNFGKDENGDTIITHEHRIWRDKIYATVNGHTQPGPALSVVYAGDKDNPELLTTWDLSDEAGMPESGTHDLDISPDGTRAYINIRNANPDGGPRDDGLLILDTSEVANWEPGMPQPTIRRISKPLYWTALPGSSHSAQYMKVDGREYVVVMNEGTGCPAPWAQIVDVNDERNPSIISTFRLEVNDPENCDRTRPDHDGFTLGDPGGIYGILLQYRYGSHYLGVDNVEDAKMVAFTWYSGGLRLVDVRDPYNPKEVGYFIPPAIETGGAQPRPIPDRVYSFVRFHEGNIWFTSVSGGFWAVRYTGKPIR